MVRKLGHVRFEQPLAFVAIRKDKHLCPRLKGFLLPRPCLQATTSRASFSTPPGPAGDKSEAPKEADASKKPPGGDSDGSDTKDEVPPKTRSNNLLVGLVLVGFAVGAYYFTIDKMKKQVRCGAVGRYTMSPNAPVPPMG